MKKLDINLENCFGIGKFIQVFDFDLTATNTFLIYAPNGTMKTSFARTLSLLSKNNPSQLPCDKVYPERAAKYSVLADGNQISADSILVINAEDNSFDATDKISSFIASKALKEQYDKIYEELELKKKAFLKRLKDISQSSDCEGEIIATFQSSSKESIFEILLNINSNLLEKPTIYKFRYNDIFDTKGAVQKFLIKNEKLLDLYIEKYKKVLSNSTFFKGSANTFGTYQANKIMDSVEGDSFFEAGHALTLGGGENINSSNGLKEVVRAEIDRIINEPELKLAFQKVDKEITANVDLRKFQEVIEKDQSLLLELKKYEDFKKKVWIDYLSQMKNETDELVQFYNIQKPAIDAILTDAKQEVEIWKDIVETFNSRFYVPFVVSLVNQEDVLLKKDTATLEFHYDDKVDNVKLQDKNSLLSVLSKGEQRAYHILQFLFEIESRKALNLDTLLVFDDIADSFDYKNKFAIVEYIKDLNFFNGFRIIILTHNFDFYRTISSRLNLNKKSVYIAVKNKNREVSLVEGQFKKNVFVELLPKIDEKSVFVSLLPFLRNLIEYSEGNKSPEYLKLTSCLHIKNDTASIDAGYLLNIYKSKLPKKTSTKTISFSSENIKDLIYDVANNIRDNPSPDVIALENKIVLSMAIRLKAEEYIISKLPAFNSSLVNYNQTKYLYDEFLKIPGYKKASKKVLDKVILMTPENIHINAFMYEPLIDMGLGHLIDLYKEMDSLT